MYIGPEFLLGQVYDGTSEFGESIVLYRPVYPTVKSERKGVGLNNTNTVNNSIQSQPQSSASTPNATKGLKVDVPKDLSIQQQSQPQLHQPGTSSAATATNNKANKTTEDSVPSPTSNSNLISATPSSSGATTAIDTETASTSASVLTPSTETSGQSVNKPLGTGKARKNVPAPFPLPGSSSSHNNSSILPTVHKTRVPAVSKNEGDGKSKEGISAVETENSVTSSSNMELPGCSSGSKKLKKLSSTTSSGSGGIHVSFESETSTAPLGESGCTSKKLKTPSTSSSVDVDVVSASGSGSKKDLTKTHQATCGKGQIQSAAVEGSISKMKDDTISKNREVAQSKSNTSAVFPGKVVKLEAASGEDTSVISATEGASFL